MVDRCLTFAPGSLMAVDLDGTYLTVNSLHEYLKNGMLHLMRQGHPWRALRVMALLLLRRTGSISHRTMKWGALRAVGFDVRMVADFACSVQDAVNPAVEGLMKECAGAGGSVLIATAAAVEYVRAIAPCDYVATEIEGNGSMTECRGEEKARRVRAYAAERGLKLDMVVTDHPDDLPLLRACSGMKVIVGADAAFRSLLLREFEPSELLFIE